MIIASLGAYDWKSHFSIYFAGLREFFRAKLNFTCSDYSSGELTREMGLPYSEKEHIKLEVQTTGENDKCADSAEAPQQSPSRQANTSGSFLQLNDAADEFFDVIDESDNDQTEVLWPSDEGMHSQVSA